MKPGWGPGYRGDAMVFPAGDDSDGDHGDGDDADDDYDCDAHDDDYD